MNRRQLPSASQAESADSTGKVVASDAEPIPEGLYTTEDSIETWLLIVTGFFSAALTAGLLCRSPLPHALSWARLFLRSIGYIALTAAAGILGTWISRFFLRAKPSFSMAFLAKKVGIGWVFLPCITLLYLQRSPWMLLVLAVATVGVAFSLRPIFPAGIEPYQKLPSDLPALYGLPIAAFRPLREFFIALCAQGAFIFAIMGSLFPAGILLSASLSLLVWRWIASDNRAATRFTGEKPSILLCAFALLLTILVLIPAISDTLHGAFGQNDQLHKPPSVARQPAEPDRPNSDYVGIILWPPPIKKEIIPPLPRDHSFAIGGAAKPVIIPFDGPYWYFKAPSRRPGPHAHIAHGKPTDVTVRSSDWAPLLMEAHQNLGTSIDLACCSEIDVALTNADTRPGRIALGIVLTDSNSTVRPSWDLGEQPIVSSEADQIPINRLPVKEVLRFPISRFVSMRRFNEITIVFLPAKERARGGAKVSIQSFTLIPR